MAWPVSATRAQYPSAFRVAPVIIMAEGPIPFCRISSLSGDLTHSLPCGRVGSCGEDHAVVEENSLNGIRSGGHG